MLMFRSEALTMNAINDIRGQLCWVPVEAPELGPGEVRIQVHASAVNRADLVQRAGRYPPPPGVTDILGLECSGRIVEVGPDVDRSVGEEVCALLAGGGYAEQVVCPASHALPLPPGLDLTEAAAIPEVFTTAWLNLRREGELQEGESVLVHAGASGVGTAAIMLCVAWGNPVFVTVGSEVKVNRCLALGAAEAANRKEGPWGNKVRAWGGADVILDPVGGVYLESNIHALRPRGRLVNIGLMGGVQGTLPLGRLLVHRLRIVGSVLRSRSCEEKTDILSAMRDELWPLFQDQSLRPIIHRTYSIEEAEEAHKLVKSDQTIGKVILKVPT